MKTKCVIVNVLLVILANKPAPADAQAINVQDSLALVDLYNATAGATDWTIRTNWLTSPVNTWYGITVTGTRVSSINLTGNNLFGALPSSIGNLNQVTQLSLSYNNLSGPIPGS